MTNLNAYAVSYYTDNGIYTLNGYKRELIEKTVVRAATFDDAVAEVEHRAKRLKMFAKIERGNGFEQWVNVG